MNTAENKIDCNENWQPEEDWKQILARTYTFFAYDQIKSSLYEKVKYLSQLERMILTTISEPKWQQKLNKHILYEQPTFPTNGVSIETNIFDWVPRYYVVAYLLKTREVNELLSQIRHKRERASSMWAYLNAIDSFIYKPLKDSITGSVILYKMQDPILYLKQHKQLLPFWQLYVLRKKITLPNVIWDLIEIFASRIAYKQRKILHYFESQTYPRLEYFTPSQAEWEQVKSSVQKRNNRCLIS